MLYVDCILVLTKVLPDLKYITLTLPHSENSLSGGKGGQFHIICSALLMPAHYLVIF